MSKPIIALVGRPNVGKSTLFNRLVGERMAVVDETPGTTRDRIMGEAEWLGVQFWVIDTGGIDPTQTGPGKTQKPLSIGSADFIDEIRQQAVAAIQESDVVLFVTEAESGVTPADQEVANILRRNQKEVNGELRPPVFLVVNKADSATRRYQGFEFYSLGLGEPYTISALHGTETGDLLDAVVASFKGLASEPEDDDSVKIAIVGKPNVGKSSLLNRLLGEERAIVSPIAGTTRDAIDTHFTFNELPITLIDTAGIRRRGRIEPGVEKFSVLRSFQAIERADVALLVIDASEGLSAQDAHIAGFILDAWKSVVVVVNKWDTLEKDNHTMEEFTRTIRHELNFLDYVPILYVSAKTNQRVSQIMPTALQVQEERLARLSTSQLNQILQGAQSEHAAPSRTGRQLKMYYGTQVRSDPPTFLIYVNDPKLAHFSYQRFLENKIREFHPFVGTPIRIVMRPRH